MELVRGTPLDRFLADHGAIPLERLVPVVDRICEVVHTAHEQGIVHRDIKPSNILFDNKGNPYISDFGIAKLSAENLTESAIIGVPAYMAPEQARGEAIDGRVDIYALGTVLYEMVSGRQPYEADTAIGVMMKHINDPIPHILDVNPNLHPIFEKIIQKAMAKDIKNRFSTVAEITNVLKKMAQNKDLKLSHLSLRNKGLTEIPDYVFNLEHLRTLDISGNQLSALSKSITKLKNLTGLFLSNNQFTDLPEEVLELPNLAVLDLEGNKLASLPDTIKKLQKLTGLFLGHNRLIAFPDVVLDLPKLLWMDLNDNQIPNIPDGVTELRELLILELTGNPLMTPPIEVADQGAEAIKEYFRQLRDGQDYLYEAKLLILGEGGAGKTTLARKITNPDYKLQAYEKSTEGIDILQWSFPLENHKIFRVNIWDFGGQEIYHTTHQYFLTKRSLYALVADTRKEDTNFYYWLNVIEMLSDQSPVLIIKNEKQDRHREINELQLRGQFENLKEILETNLGDNRGLDKISVKIIHMIQELPHVGSLLPKTWVRVRETLEKDKRNHIGLNEYLDICWKSGFTESADSLQLSDYLHDLGVILHFSNDPLLRKTIILKPKWGTDAAYKVLDNQKVIRNLGRFTRDDLSTIWNDAIYADMRDELLRLMMKFHLCYEIPNTPDTYIAPQLLTENQPDYEWDTKENLSMLYTYEFMPKGILTQFIVIMHPLIIEQRYVWKSGLIIEKDKTRAEIIEHYGKREIRIRVHGAHKIELLAIAMFQLDQIHASFRRLKYEKWIPCNCSDCRAVQEPYFYRYDILQKFIEDKQEQIQCQHSYNMVDVRGLLLDVFAGGSQSEKNDGEKIMTKYEINIGAGAKVDGHIVLGSAIENSFIQESFNKAASADISIELKETLKQLARAVDVMNQALTKEQSQEVAGDLDALVQESTKKSPRSKWYQLSADGLIKAAENVGQVGQPVIELAGKVVSLLMALSK